MTKLLRCVGGVIAATSVVWCLTITAFAASGDNFEIDIQTNVQMQSPGFSSQTPTNIVMNIRGNQIFVEEIQKNYGTARKNKGTVYDKNASVNCASSRFNPAGPGTFRNKEGTTKFLARSCVANSRFGTNSIDLSMQNAMEWESNFKSYGVHSNLQGTSSMTVSYDLASKTCNLTSYNMNISNNQVGTFGSYPNNADTTIYSAVASSCTLRRR